MDKVKLDSLQVGVLIDEKRTVKEALKRLDKTAKRTLLVVDKKRRLLGTVTDGDIRRYLLKGRNLEDGIKGLYNKKPVHIRKDEFTIDLAKEKFITSKMELVPILDEENRVVNFITWDQTFSEDKNNFKENKINLPVVIMAGGKGERLEPFNKIFPKPLIPVGDKTIIEMIIDEFKKQGVYKYYLTLNYKGQMIESYFNSIEKDYEVEFVRENEFLGTAGSLKLIEDKINDTFIVSNCDVIVRADFADVVNFHRKYNASLTILSAIRHYKIPYGIIKFKKGGELIDISEKPEYTFTINTGVYILNRKSLKFIPKDTSFDMTSLIKKLIKHNQKIITYPVNENDYIDIGQSEEYKKSLAKLKFLG